MTDLDLGPLEELPDAEPTLRKSADGRRFVCVRRGDGVAVLDDRCPHEGYPLSGGAVKDGVLTCRWHNWKFELETGACVFGGEPVRGYPVRIEAGRVWIDARIDPAAERARLDGSLRASLRDGSMGSVMRDGLRLAALDGSLEGALGVVASDAAQRAPWGFEHGLAMLADVSAWIAEGLVDGPAAFAAVTSHVAEPLLYAPVALGSAGGGRGDGPSGTTPKSSDQTASQLLAALRDERRDEATALARELAADPDALVERALVPHLAADLTEYGHGAIYALKARELAARFPTHAADLWASVVTAIGWATIDSALPGWKATHEGIRAVARAGDGPLEDRAAYEASVLSCERDAVAACLARLEAGVAPRALLLASARAAAERLRRFDDAWQRRLDAPVTILDVSHALTFAEAALSLTDGAGLDAARFAVQSAGFVGKLHKADSPSRPPEGGGETELVAHRHRATPPPSSPEASPLQTALVARDLPAALAATDGPTADDPTADDPTADDPTADDPTADDPAAFWPTVAHFALHEAFVRPIFAAHAVKTTEACRRLEALDPSGAPTYRAGLMTLMVPRRPERFFERTAAIAARFLEDGRPPPGLY